MRRAASDDVDQLRRLYESTLDDVFGYLMVRCGGNRALAEDLCSETYLAAADRIARDGPQRVSVSWLNVVARNKLVDHWRRHGRDERRSAQLRLVRTDDGSLTMDRVLDHHAVVRALNTLGADQRLALVLHYLDGVPSRELAAILGRSVAATESLLARARRQLGAALGEAR